MLHGLWACVADAGLVSLEVTFEKVGEERNVTCPELCDGGN